MNADTPGIDSAPERLLSSLGAGAASSSGATAAVTSQAASFKCLGSEKVPGVGKCSIDILNRSTTFRGSCSRPSLRTSHRYPYWATLWRCWAGRSTAAKTSWRLHGITRHLNRYRLYLVRTECIACTLPIAGDVGLQESSIEVVSRWQRNSKSTLKILKLNAP